VAEEKKTSEGANKTGVGAGGVIAPVQCGMAQMNGVGEEQLRG